MKIFRIERTEIGDNAKMFGMKKHGAKQSQERVGESLAKSRSDREGLMGFDHAAIPSKTDGFIQIDTEHGVGCFKTAQRVQVGFGFFNGERGSPILRHRADTKRRKSNPHCKPPRGQVKEFCEYNKTFKNG